MRPRKRRACRAARSRRTARGAARRKLVIRRGVQPKPAPISVAHVSAFASASAAKERHAEGRRRKMRDVRQQNQQSGQAAVRQYLPGVAPTALFETQARFAAFAEAPEQIRGDEKSQQRDRAAKPAEDEHCPRRLPPPPTRRSVLKGARGTQSARYRQRPLRPRAQPRV